MAEEKKDPNGYDEMMDWLYQSFDLEGNPLPDQNDNSFVALSQVADADFDHAMNAYIETDKWDPDLEDLGNKRSLVASDGGHESNILPDNELVELFGSITSEGSNAVAAPAAGVYALAAASKNQGSSSGVRCKSCVAAHVKKCGMQRCTNCGPGSECEIRGKKDFITKTITWDTRCQYCIQKNLECNRAPCFQCLTDASKKVFRCYYHE
jgi:hypothetical protein